MSRGPLSGAAALLLLAAACHHRPPEDPSAAPVAWVNGQVLTRAEFERELGRSLELPDGNSAPAPDQLAALRRTVLQTRVDRLLFVQEAATRGLEIPPADVEQRLQRMRADWPPEEFEALLVQRQQTLEELRADLRAQLVQERLFHELVYPRVAVTEEEIRTELDAHPELLHEPEQVHAAQIVVKELDQAKEIRARLREGAKFADLARERSLSADAKDGGDLGWFQRGVMPPQFDEVAFSLGPGQISDVVTTDYGFHVFKVLERRPARKKDLTAVRAEVERRLLRGKQEQAQTEFVNQLRARATIRINDPLVAQVVPHAPAGQAQETPR
ncbi:MAG TPA: peptidylprolyl isomerase [Myxococcaceae bacterium]|nr:peptidylprolyl isomerase [Myxococcaceae bacterium]